MVCGGLTEMTRLLNWSLTLLFTEGIVLNVYFVFMLNVVNFNYGTTTYLIKNGSEEISEESVPVFLLWFSFSTFLFVVIPEEHILVL